MPECGGASRRFYGIPKLLPIWIAGFGPMRPANGVHDPITIRSLVVARNGNLLKLTGVPGLVVDRVLVELALGDVVAQRLLRGSGPLHHIRGRDKGAGEAERGDYAPVGRPLLALSWRACTRSR